MRTLFTKYIAPKSSTPAKIKAWTDGGVSVVVSYAQACADAKASSNAAPHFEAVKALVKKYNLQFRGVLAVSGGYDGGPNFCFTFVSDNCPETFTLSDDNVSGFDIPAVFAALKAEGIDIAAAFHTLSSTQTAALAALAKAQGYKPPKGERLLIAHRFYTALQIINSRNAR